MRPPWHFLKHEGKLHHMQNNKRSFLFLQGPLSPFFRELGKALRDSGCEVHRINFCGGDVVYWPHGNTHWWLGHVYEWPLWIASLMKKYEITDIVLMGDWRPLHREAIWLGRQRGNRIWVFEEGYLRPGYVTLEEGGVNAYSSLPRTPEDIRKRAFQLKDDKAPVPSDAPNPMFNRVLKTAWNHVGNILLWPVFHRYRTHRPYTIGRELTGHIPRYLNRKKRRKHGVEVTDTLLKGNIPFYLMPLQLDADSQVRRHSPFTGMLECMAMVITDFARNAPAGTFLVFKNHPLDNGLRNYRRYMRSLGRATGCSERIRFVEEVNPEPLCKKALGLVLCNSTIGISALQLNKPVYCLGQSIYAMPGLAVNSKQMSLSEFWYRLPKPNPVLVDNFISVLKNDALVPGNFYSKQGIRDAVEASLIRMNKQKEITMSDVPVFRPAAEDDAPVLAEKITEVSPEVVDTLLGGLVPGINTENILAMALRDSTSHYSCKNCVLAEVDGRTAGLLFAYPADKQGIPTIMESMIPSSRLDPLREILSVSAQGSLYINTLWVDQQFRGQGMADSLIDYARFWAESLNLKSLSLFCWRDNTRAVSFYLRQGFRVVQEISAQGPLTANHEKGDLYVLSLEESD